jgi:hypothetical protein
MDHEPDGIVRLTFFPRSAHYWGQGALPMLAAESARQEHEHAHAYSQSTME